MDIVRFDANNRMHSARKSVSRRKANSPSLDYTSDLSHCISNYLDLLKDCLGHENIYDLS